MLTYNQRAFVSEAINSVVAQQTSFPVEVVIGEDCSTDGTREIVSSYAERCAERVRVISSEANVGMYRNLVRTWAACRGRYIAVLEGDDYWSCSTKLQRQVEWLEAHPTTTVCAHQARVIGDGGEDRGVIPLSGATATFEDLLLTNLIPTCSVMYRAGIVTAIPAWIDGLKLGDWPLHLLHAQQGNAVVLPEVWAVYRQHGAGAWSSMRLEEQIREVVKMYDAVDGHFERRYHSIVREGISRQYTMGMEYRRSHRDHLGTLRYSLRSAVANPTVANWKWLVEWHARRAARLGRRLGRRVHS
jgi:hypothetical protein